MGRYESTLLEMMQTAATVVKIQSMNLGGVPSVSGGAGGPPGGFIGYLPQNRVAYDYGEVANSGIPASGYPSLYDNLNHIRYRIEQLEEGGVAIYENAVLIASGVTIMDFEGAIITDEGSGRVTIAISGSPGGETNHALLTNLNSTNYWHLTQANHTDLTDGNDSTLHYHANDRARGNHTGSQMAATISGFDNAVSNNTDVRANTLARHTTHNAGMISDFDTEVSNNTDVAANTAARHTVHYYQTLQNPTDSNMTQRSKIKFIGATITDDAGGDRTIVTISGGVGGGIEEAPINGGTYGRKDAGWVTISGGVGGGHTILNEGTPLTQRTKLNFIGGSVNVTDNSGNDATDVTITASGEDSSQFVSSQDLTIDVDGTLAVIANVGTYISAQYATISGLYMYSSTLGSAGTTKVDIHKNGTSIFASQNDRLALAYNDGDSKVSDFTTIVALIPGDVLSWDIDEIATGMMGLNITTHLINAVVSGIVVNYGPGDTYNTYNGDATPMVNSAAQIYAYGLFR